MYDPTQDTAAGMDTLGEVSRMPLLKIIQSGSPEVKKSHKDYAIRRIEGAEEGMILLQSTGDLIKESVEIVPLARAELYAEWKPQKEGGGFVQHHGLAITTHPEYKKGSEKSDWDEFLGKNELIKTIYFFVIANIADEWTKAVLAFKRSELKHARSLNTMIASFRYPDKNCYRWEQKDGKGKFEKFVTVDPKIYSRSFTLSTVADNNDDGDWYNWHIEPNHTFELSGENAPDDLATMGLAATAMKEAIADLPEPAPIKQIEAKNSEENPY